LRSRGLHIVRHFHTSRNGTVGVLHQHPFPRQEREETVAADSPVPVAQLKRPTRRKRFAACAEVEQQEVVAEAMQLGKAHRSPV